MPVIRLLARYRKLLLHSNIVKAWLLSLSMSALNQMWHLQPHNLRDRPWDGCGSAHLPFQHFRDGVSIRPNSLTRGTVSQNSLGPDRFSGLSCWSPRIPGSEPIIPGDPHTCHIPLLKISLSSLQMVRTTRSHINPRIRRMIFFF